MDSLEEKLLAEYISECYPGINDDAREVIRGTVGFQIHILSHFHKELGKALRNRMTKAQEQFIKKFLGS
jgi:hypothetical protein